MAVLHLVAGRRVVLVGAVRLDPLHEAGIRVVRHLLPDRAAGAAVRHRVADLAVAVDDALLQHQHRLRRRDVVAVVAEHVHRRRRDHEAAREREVVLHALRRRLRMDRPATRAVGIEELVVPAGLRRPRLPALGRIEQHGDAIDATIGRATRGRTTWGRVTVLGGVLYVVGYATLSNATTYSSGSSNNVGTGVVAYLLGVAGLGAGIPLWIVGGHQHRKYNKKLEGLSFRFNMNPQRKGLTLAYRF